MSTSKVRTATGWDYVSQGPKGDPGAAGAQGATGAQGPAGSGLVVGGTTGQILSKKSATDYDTEWKDAPSGGGGGAPGPWVRLNGPTTVYSPTEAWYRLEQGGTVVRLGGTIYAKTGWVNLGTVAYLPPEATPNLRVTTILCYVGTQNAPPSQLASILIQSDGTIALMTTSFTGGVEVRLGEFTYALSEHN